MKFGIVQVRNGERVAFEIHEQKPLTPEEQERRLAAFLEGDLDALDAKVEPCDDCENEDPEHVDTPWRIRDRI